MPPKKTKIKNGDLREMFAAGTSKAAPVVPSTVVKAKPNDEKTPIWVRSDDAEDVQTTTDKPAVDADGFLLSEIDAALAESSEEPIQSTDLSRAKGKGKSAATWVESDSDDNAVTVESGPTDNGFLESDLEQAVIESSTTATRGRPTNGSRGSTSSSLSYPLNAPSARSPSSAFSSFNAQSLPITPSRVSSTVPSQKRVLDEVSLSAAKRLRTSTATAPTPRNVNDADSRFTLPTARLPSSTIQDAVNVGVDARTGINAGGDLDSPSDVSVNDDDDVGDGDHISNQAGAAMDVDELQGDDEEVDELADDGVVENDVIMGDNELQSSPAQSLLTNVLEKANDAVSEANSSVPPRTSNNPSLTGASLPHSSSAPPRDPPHTPIPSASNQPAAPQPGGVHPTVYTKTGTALKEMSANPDAIKRRERRKEQKDTQEKRAPVEAQTLLDNVRKPFDHTIINQASTVPNDAATCVGILKAKSDAFRDHDERTKHFPEEWTKLATYPLRTLRFLAEVSINPIGFDLEGAEDRGVLRRCETVSSVEHPEKKQADLYFRHRWTSREELLRVCDDLEARVPQDKVMIQALREIIMRLPDKFFREFYAGYAIGTTAFGRWLQSLFASHHWDRFSHRLEAGDPNSREFAVSVFVDFHHVFPDELQGYKIMQLHELKRFGGTLEQMIHDASRGGIIWNVAPGGLWGPWFLRSATTLIETMTETRALFPLPEQHPLPLEMKHNVQNLAQVIDDYARSNGVELHPEFVQYMTRHVMPTGVTAHGRVAVVTILDAPRKTDLDLHGAFWSRFPGRGGWLQETALDLVYGRIARLIPEDLDDAAIAERRFCFFNMHPYGPECEIAGSALLTTAYILATNPVVVWIQSVKVFHLFFSGYLDFRGCRIAYDWARDPNSASFPEAIAALNAWWDVKHVPHDRNALNNSAAYATHVGQKMDAIVGIEPRSTFTQRHLGAEKYQTVTAKLEEFLLGQMTGLRYITEVCAHDVPLHPTKVDIALFNDTYEYIYAKVGLKEMSEKTRDDLNRLRHAYSVVQGTARASREAAAASAEGPEVRAAFELIRSNIGSHGNQLANERALRAIGPPGFNPVRMQFILGLLDTFIDAKNRNTQEPFYTPPSICPYTRMESFLTWGCTRPEGCILMRSANQRKGFDALTPEQMEGKKERCRSNAQQRSLMVGTFQAARDAKSMLQDMLQRAAEQGLGAHPTKGATSRWLIGCEACPSSDRCYGSQNTKHQCPNTLDGQVVQRVAGQLHHVTITTPYHLLHNDPDVTVLPWLRDPQNGFISETIDHWLPANVDYAALGHTLGTHDDVVVVCRVQDLALNDTPEVLKWQGAIGYILAHHVHRPIDEFACADTDQGMEPVVKAMAGPNVNLPARRRPVVVESDECRACYYRGIIVLPREESADGTKILKQHRPRNGKTVRPPRTYLPESYAELEFTQHTPLDADGKGPGPCLREHNPSVLCTVRTFFDLPLAWKIRFATAVVFPNDPLHRHFRGWTLTDLFNWRQ